VGIPAASAKVAAPCRSPCKVTGGQARGSDELAQQAGQAVRPYRLSRAQIPRAARYLQGLVNAVAEMGWSVPAKVQAAYASRGEPSPDLSIRLPSREILVTVRELDERGHSGRAFITQTDYLPDTERTTVNRSFTASGRLEVTLARGLEHHPVLSQRDTGKSTLEDQLPVLIRVIEISKVEADWAQKEEGRRGHARVRRRD